MSKRGTSKPAKGKQAKGKRSPARVVPLKESRKPLVIGWREWVALPSLGIPWTKAKIDTGARSSSLHGIHVRNFVRRGEDWVRFEVHPLQRSIRETVTVEAPVLEYRKVRSSSGHSSLRPVIEAEVQLCGVARTMEITLADRDQMGFRMLIGRQGMRKRFLIDPGLSYAGGKPSPRQRGRGKGHAKCAKKDP